MMNGSRRRASLQHARVMPSDQRKNPDTEPSNRQDRSEYTLGVGAVFALDLLVNEL